MNRLAMAAFAALFTIGLFSCHAKHDLTYFDDLAGKESGTLPVSGDYSLRIEPEDELAITVTSIDPEATAMYNTPLPAVATAGSLDASQSPRLLSYTVNRLGDIDFPVLGTIHVAGMTTLELKQYLYKEISKTVANPVINVDLLNFKVNVLGEVGGGHSLRVSSERFSIFDALAAAGDLTPYAKRESVLVIRTMPDGTTTFQRLNLHDSSITASPYFYLKQNDVIYVEPNRIRQENAKVNQNNSYKLSVFTAIVSVVSTITALVIALAK